MKISIITVCFNSSDFIACAIRSVWEQTYKDYEYLIIDGGSQDNTVDIIKDWEPKFSGRMRWMSEKDKGIYYAMNKGIQASSGEVVGFLNSDDSFFHDGVLAAFDASFLSSACDAVYADLVYVDRNNTQCVQRVWTSAAMPFFRMYFGWHPAHPTFYVKKEIYDRFGSFNTNYKIAADYELMVRFIQKNQISCCYLPQTVVQMRSGGISNASMKNIFLSNLECWKSWTENGFFYNPFGISLKFFHKISQWGLGLWSRITNFVR